MLIVGQQESFK